MPRTSITPMRMAAVAGIGIIMWWFILAAAFGLLSGCATTPTPAEMISVALDRQLTMLADLPLSIRCQAVEDAIARCERAGLPSDCAWDERFDASTEEACWTIMACKARRAP